MNIQKRLQISDEDMTNIKLDIGMTYLKERLGEHAHIVWKNKDFWSWFNRMWDNHDKAYENYVNKGLIPTLGAYMIYHSTVIRKYEPNKSICSIYSTTQKKLEKQLLNNN